MSGGPLYRDRIHWGFCLAIPLLAAAVVAGWKAGARMACVAPLKTPPDGAGASAEETPCHDSHCRVPAPRGPFRDSSFRGSQGSLRADAGITWSSSSGPSSAACAESTAARAWCKPGESLAGKCRGAGRPLASPPVLAASDRLRDARRRIARSRGLGQGVLERSAGRVPVDLVPGGNAEEPLLFYETVALAALLNEPRRPASIVGDAMALLDQGPD